MAKESGNDNYQEKLLEGEAIFADWMSSKLIYHYLSVKWFGFRYCSK